MNAKVKIDLHDKILCTLFKDEKGKAINKTIDNVHEMKWSYGASDEYPICAISYLEASGREVRLVIPSADVDLEMGSFNWTLKTDLDRKEYVLAHKKHAIACASYIEIIASRRLVSAGPLDIEKPKNKVTLSFVSDINENGVTINMNAQKLGSHLAIQHNGHYLGGLTRATMTVEAGRKPEAEILMTVEYDGQKA